MVHKVLLTGANGFLGKNLQRNTSPRSYEFLDIHSLFKERIDISKPFAFCEDPDCDIVLHAAGRAHLTPKTAKDKEEFIQVNYQGTVNLCKALDRVREKPKAFIFISTVAVYGVDTGKNIKENHALKGSSPYAKSKILAEKYLEHWAEQNDITLSILRLPLVVGQNPPGNLGKMIKGIKSGKYLSIGKADARKSMVWAGDIVQIIPKLSEIGGIYNLTDETHPSFKELEKYLSKALKKSKPHQIPLALAKVMAKIGDLLGATFPINTPKLNKITSNLTFDDYKAQKKLAWKPTKVLTKIEEIV